MTRRWLLPTESDDRLIAELSASIRVSPVISGMLIRRGVTSYQQAHNYFVPDLSRLHDPFLMRDMDVAVERIRKALDSGERILVYGDYDVDGTTSVALVYRFLRELNPEILFYIPDRNKEGYGVSEAGIAYASAQKVSLIIALDLGIKATARVDLAAEAGIDFIICDHHLPDAEIPRAVAVLDPKRSDCQYPYKELSGCGIGFKLIQAYARRYGHEESVYRFLDLVAVSIASDIVPVTGENRILAHFGLRQLVTGPCPGLKALMKISSLQREPDVNTLVFTIGPRINAAGRVAHASAAVDLLISADEDAADELARQVEIKNSERRVFDLSITEEALSMIDSDAAEQRARTTVLYKETWHKGVVGIVASRIQDKYYRPTIILTLSNGKITGSARSVHGFNLYQAISECSDLLEQFGGHHHAAGLTLKPENLKAFRARFEEVVSASISEDMLQPVLSIDGVVSLDQLTPNFHEVLRRMAPFGPGNPNPLFVAHGIRPRYAQLLKERHVKFQAVHEGSAAKFHCISFDHPEHFDRVASGDPVDLAFHLEENVYNGVTSLQLRIKDIHAS